MSSSKVACLLFTLSIILISHAPIASSDKDMIDELCNNANEVGFGNGITLDDCSNLMGMNPRFHSASDYHILSKYIMQFAIQKGTQNMNNFKALHKKFPNSKAIVQCGTTFYTSIISFFKSALKDWDSKAQNAVKEATKSRDGSEQCKVAIQNEKIVNGSIVNMNKMMFLLTDVTVSSMDLATP